MARKSHTRNAQATRAALLASAQRLFVSHRYEDVRLKDIAAGAGVDAALIARYFFSKPLLFTHVLEQVMAVSDLTEGERRTFGRRMAAAAVRGEQGSQSLTASVLISLNVGSPEASGIIHEVVRDSFLKRFASWLGGDNAILRAHLILNLLGSVGIGRTAFGSNFMTEEMIQKYELVVGDTLQSWVDGV